VGGGNLNLRNNEATGRSGRRRQMVTEQNHIGTIVWMLHDTIDLIHTQKSLQPFVLAIVIIPNCGSVNI
jgi:hypothetical protein